MIIVKRRVYQVFGDSVYSKGGKICKNPIFCNFFANVSTLVIFFSLKLNGNVQFVQKVTCEPSMDFKQNHYWSEVENITKAATFKKFPSPKL